VVNPSDVLAEESAKQSKEAQAQLHSQLEKMLAEVKRKLKPESKNELIRIIGALLLDNYSLKLQLAEALKTNPSQESEKNENPQV
jgi:predicted transcriptional regulator